MTLATFYGLDYDQRKSLLTECCGSARWVNDMLHAPPVSNIGELLARAAEKWKACTDADAKEAFSHHPKIGDADALKKKFATDRFAASEQAAVSDASDETIAKLAEANKWYEEKFGYIFIVFATRKSASQMLEMLLERLKNNDQEEIAIAREEQFKITQLRLQKLFSI